MIIRLFTRKQTREKQEYVAKLQAYYDTLINQQIESLKVTPILHHNLFANHYIGVDDQWHRLPFKNNRSDETPWLFDGQIFFKPTPRLSSGRGNV